MLPKVVGKEEQEPICNPSFDFGTAEMNHIIQEFLSPDKPYTDARELCVNTLFNGSQHGNLGGVCLQRILKFPDEFKSPRLTPAFYPSPLSLSIMAVLATIQGFCQANCRCPTDDELIELRRLAKQRNKLDRQQPLKYLPQEYHRPNVWSRLGTRFRGQSSGKSTMSRGGGSSKSKFPPIRWEPKIEQTKISK